MHAVCRWYSGEGASQLFDELERRRSEVETLIRGVTGLVSYSLVRMPAGGLSVTVCQDKSGTDESVRIAADWIKQNISTSTSPPQVSEGDVILQLN